MKQIDVIAAVLVVVGALNWGFVAVARFDLVAALFGMRFGEVSAAQRRRLRAGRPRRRSIRRCSGSACRAAGRSPRRCTPVNPSPVNNQGAEQC